MKKSLLIALACAGVVPMAQGQTGRIAHFSHGGSPATLAAQQEATDNFGNPQSYFAVDSVRYLSSTAVLQYGKWRWTHRKETTDTLQLPKKMSTAEAARYVQHTYEVRWAHGGKKQLVGFDSTSKAPFRPPLRLEHKRKAATAGGLFWWPPAGPRLALLLLVGLAGTGWLLGGKAQSVATT